MRTKITQPTKKRAFTLIEVLGVIAIISILTVATYMGFNQVWRNNQIDVTENDLRDFANSFSSYQIDYGSIILEDDSNYQTALEQVVETLNRQYLSAVVEIESIASDRKSCTLITKSKKDPWGGKYLIRLNTYKGVDGGMLVIYSKGADGIDGSAAYASDNYSDDVIAVVQPKEGG